VVGALYNIHLNACDREHITGFQRGIESIELKIGFHDLEKVLNFANENVH